MTCRPICNRLLDISAIVNSLSVNARSMTRSPQSEGRGNRNVVPVLLLPPDSDRNVGPELLLQRLQRADVVVRSGVAAGGSGRRCCSGGCRVVAVPVFVWSGRGIGCAGRGRWRRGRGRRLMIWWSCLRYCGELHQQRELTQIMSAPGQRGARARGRGIPGPASLRSTGRGVSRGRSSG